MYGVFNGDGARVPRQSSPADVGSCILYSTTGPVFAHHRLSYCNILVFGPIAAAVYGALEIALLYLLVLVVLPEPALLILFHIGYLVVGAAAFWFSLRMSHYQFAPGSEVPGRFRRRATLWH